MILPPPCLLFRVSQTKKESIITAVKLALVTGSSKRIGKAMALALAEKGWSVAVHFNGSKEEADKTVWELKKFDVKAEAFRCDLSQEGETSRLIGRINRHMGPLSLLVNNAACFELDRVETATRETWDKHLETNLRAPFVLSQTFAEQLPDETQGLIVNMLDQRVWNLTPHFLSYTVAKAGLWTLTQTLAQAFGPKIRVNGIGPGFTLAAPNQSQAHFESRWKNTPLKKSATPDDVVSALLYLISAESVTGQMIALDGGQHLGWGQVSYQKSGNA